MMLMKVVAFIAFCAVATATESEAEATSQALATGPSHNEEIPYYVTPSKPECSIPKRHSGHALGSPQAPVKLEVFLDFQSPDAKAIWSTMKQLVQFYGYERLLFVVHAFPLPYHRNGFIAAQAAYVASACNPKLFWPFADLLFQKQDELCEHNTFTMTEEQIFDLLASYACALNIAKDSFKQGMFDTKPRDAVKESYKYWASQGIHTVPTFMINGRILKDVCTLSFEEWRALLDPLYA